MDCTGGQKKPAPPVFYDLFSSAHVQVRQLNNGDLFKGTYGHGGLKVGDGVYHFANGDVYEGEFDNDRMQGLGVYTFATQGRYEGQVSAQCQCIIGNKSICTCANKFVPANMKCRYW